MDRTSTLLPGRAQRAIARIALVGLSLTLVMPAPPASAAPTATFVRVIRTFRWNTPSPDPTGLAYLPAKRALVVVDSEVDETPHFQGKNIWFAKLRGGVIRSFDTLDYSVEPTDVAVAGVGKALFVSDDSMDRVFTIKKGPDKAFGTADDPVTSFSTRGFGSHDPAGLAFGAKSLWVTDGDNLTSKQRVYRIRRGSNGVFDGVAPGGDDIVKSFSTVGMGLRRPSDIAYDPDTGHLFIVSALDDFIAETTITGSLVRTYDMSATNMRYPAGIVLAPASNGSGDVHVYVSDRGLDNDDHPKENDGRIFEFKLTT
jgi:DNA-binding beta-propeller fold protein YncE